MEKIRLLYLAASPAGGPPEVEINVDGDYDAIRQACAKAGALERFHFRRLIGVQPGELVAQLNTWNPHVVHFSGHGLRGKGLVFTNTLGEAVLADAAGLTQLFLGAAGLGLRLVVLMTCYSLPLAQAIAPYVQIAIGVEDRIEEGSATAFNSGFYTALAAGRTFQQAYDQGVGATRFDQVTARNRPEFAFGSQADEHCVLQRRSAPADAQLEQGVRLLDLRLYVDAASCFREALRTQSTPQGHYYLAYAMLRGRRPAQLASLDEVRAIEAHVAAAARLDGEPDGEAHPLYLWAWLKLDYYTRHRVLNSRPPELNTLLKLASRARQVPREIERLLTLAPIDGPDDVVIAAIRSRYVA